MRLHINHLRVLGQYPASIIYVIFWVLLFLLMVVR